MVVKLRFLGLHLTFRKQELLPNAECKAINKDMKKMRVKTKPHGSNQLRCIRGSYLIRLLQFCLKERELVFDESVSK
jgi:hypothetical protein